MSAALSERLGRRPAQEWLELFYREKIPAAPINSVPEVLEDPQVLAREMVVELPHPTAGSIRMVGSPLKLSETPVSYRSHPPLLGEHTDEVLAELGYSEEQVLALKEQGAV